MSAQPQPQADVELNKLLAQAREREATPRQQAIAKVAYNHAAMIDLILANPGISQNQLAAHFGLTPSWVSQVMVSDAFQSAMAKRREEVVDPLLIATVEENFKALVARSLDVLQQKLNRPALEVPDNLALRALEIGSRAAGYGVKDAGAAPIGGTPAEVHIHLEQLGGGLIALLQRKKREASAEVIDVAAEQPVRGAYPELTAEAEVAHVNAERRLAAGAPSGAGGNLERSSISSAPQPASSLLAALTNDDVSLSEEH